MKWCCERETATDCKWFAMSDDTWSVTGDHVFKETDTSSACTAAGLFAITCTLKALIH